MLLVFMMMKILKREKEKKMGKIIQITLDREEVQELLTLVWQQRNRDHEEFPYDFKRKDFLDELSETLHDKLQGVEK